MKILGALSQSVQRVFSRWTRVCLLVVALLILLTPQQSGADVGAASGAGAQLPLEPKALVAKDVGSDAPSAHALKLPQAPAEFSSYDGGWIQMAYHPSLAARVRSLQQEADQVKSQLSTILGRPVLRKVFVRVGRTAGEMETLAPVGTGFPKYASGVAYSELGLVLLTSVSRYPGEDLDLGEVFRHELAHIALHDAVGRDNVPRWFNEGFAIHASGEAQTARMQSLWTATVSGNLLPFARLTRSFPNDASTASVAYAQAADLVRFLLRNGQEHRFEALIHRLGRGQEFNAALADAYQTDMYSLEKTWREDVARRYTFWPILFGGSLIWVFAFGLMIGGYVKRKRRAQVKLNRWAEEEALEDVRREELTRRVLSLESIAHGGQTRLILREGATVHDKTEGSLSLERRSQIGVLVHPIPTVEHDGERYTLH